METSSKLNTKKLVQAALLVAIIVIMSFTPLGYLRAGVIEITFIVIPVVIGAILLGPAAGAMLGGVFGITSFIQCFGMSAFGATLLGINPVLTFILCIVPRILVGWLTGIIFKAVSKADNTNFVSYGVASLSGPILNTVLFMSALILYFGKTSFIQGLQGEKNVLVFAVAFVGINGIIEAISTFIIAFAVTKALHKVLKAA